MKKLIALTTAFIMFLASINTGVFASQNDTEEVAEFLISLGMPREIVENMPKHMGIRFSMLCS